jgi:hypothetical protein
MKVISIEAKQKMEGKKKNANSQWNSLPQTPRSEQLCYQVDGLVLIIYPRIIELDNIFMFQRFQQMNL